MSAAIRLTDAAANAALDAIRDLIDAGSGAGYLEIYNGTIPTNANTAVGAQVKLGTLTFSDPCASNAASRVLTFDAVTSDPSADATGTAAWGRFYDSDSNPVLDGSCGSGAGVVIQFNTTSIVSGGPIAITALTLSIASP